METAKSIREDFLQQNAFRDDDQFSSLTEQDLLLGVILRFHEAAVAAQRGGAPLKDILAAPVREKIARAKYATMDDLGIFDEIVSDIETQLVAGSGVSA
jgi:V/A-type H+-transporting ATPase subunit A